MAVVDHEIDGRAKTSTFLERVNDRATPNAMRAVSWFLERTFRAPRGPRLGDGARPEQLDGLVDRVEIYTDDAGILHLYAKNRSDLFFAQGFVVAKERLFQLDFGRRAIAGRLSEILGPRTIGWKPITIHFKDKTLVDADRLMRTLGLRRAAEASLPLMSPDARALMDAYVAGVNSAIGRMRRRLPLEMRLLRYSPDPWSATDSLSLVRGMAFELSLSWRATLLFDAIARRLGDDDSRLRHYFQEWPAHAPPPAAWNALRDKEADSAAVEEGFRAFTALGGAHMGSNAWAISGRLTESKSPILCGDPHLVLTAPGQVMPMHLACPDLEVAGATIPGIPGLTFGHNRDIAWTITAGCGSDSDVYVEEVDLIHRRYRIEGEAWARLDSRAEPIVVKGKKAPDVFEVLSTRHGPLIDEVTRPLGQAKGPGFAHALRWAGMEPAPDFDALVGIMTATDWSEFRAALSSLRSVQANFVYADRQGHIGWQFAGTYPLRRDGSNGARPTDGASDSASWVRTLSLDELPHLFDPPTQVIVSANTKPVDERYPWSLGFTFEPHFRYERIRQLLSSHRPAHGFRVEDMPAIQMDQHSLWAKKLLQRFFVPELRGATLDAPIERRACDALLAWDGTARADSTGAAVFYATYQALIDIVLRQELSDELVIAYLELLNVSVLPFERLIEGDDPPLLRRSDRGRVAEAALRRGVATLVSRFGENIDRWRWGKMHTLWHRHRFHDSPFFRHLFSIGPFESGGDGFCVNNAHYPAQCPFEVTLGPAFRMILDLDDWNRSRIAVATGTSGNMSSPRYSDHATAWLRGIYYPMLFGDHGRVGVPTSLVPGVYVKS